MAEASLWLGLQSVVWVLLLASVVGKSLWNGEDVVVLLVHGCYEKVHRVFPDSFFVDEILHGKEFHSHVGALADKLFLSCFLEPIQLGIWVNLAPERKLRCDSVSIFFLGWLWINVSLGEVFNQLSWNLLECFLGQFVGVMLELSEGNELNDVSGHLLFVLL